MEDSIYYAVKFASATFATVCFESIEAAKKFREDHLNGLPDNEAMSDENREYWKKQGEAMKLVKIVEHQEDIEWPA